MSAPVVVIEEPFALWRLVEVLDETLASTARGQCSVGYLITRARLDHRVPSAVVSDDEFKAAIVIAVEKGYMEYRDMGLPASDGTPWLVTTATRGTQGLRHG